MKKFNLSLVAFLAMSTFASAGGDIAPVAPVVVEESTGPFYLGLAYGAANYDFTHTHHCDSTGTTIASDDVDYGTIMLQAGYKFNPYIALEGRYWIGLDEDIGNAEDLNIDTWGIYVKPMYPVTNTFDIYALLGYASSDRSNLDDPVDPYTSSVPLPYRTSYDMDGFSWGIGAAYAFTNNFSLFVDYTSLYDDDDTFADSDESWKYEDEITSWNFGVTYTF